MKKQIISAVLSAAVTVSAFGPLTLTASAAEVKSPKYQTMARRMEELGRGLIAVYRTADSRSVMTSEQGVYLSWRLLGTESLENQAFDIYRSADGSTYTKIATTGAHDATNYIDKSGTAKNTYKVVKAGASAADVAKENAASVQTNYTAKGSEVGRGNSLKNSFTYMDIPISRPDPVERMGDGKTSYYYTLDKEHEGGANDASVGDLDGDGDYEIVLKWDPTDSKDSAGADYTGNVYIDGYKISTSTDNRMWRIDLGKNVTAGAHYTQFMVYDFDGDGDSEIAMKTAPGSVDGQGNYVSTVGDTEEIRNVDNTKSYVGTSGRSKGKNLGPEYLTVFDGETGAALATTAFIPLGTSGEWGDSKYNRAERFLAGVAYLDGVHPSIIMCRGYYAKAVVRAYSWDGSSLEMQWEYDSGPKTAVDSLCGQGNHNLSIGDIDNDGFDEIVYGSAALDHDGKTVLGNTTLGHGDAMHMSDFNNDGIQEVFSVKEDQYKKEACSFRVASTGQKLFTTGIHTATSDTGRGVMDNIDDAYAAKNPNALALGWDSAHNNVHDLTGADLNAKPASAGSGSFDNFLVYWDGDLGRELLDSNIIQKYDASTGSTKRFYSASDGYTLTGATTNNYTKRNPSLVADIWGDWREEIIMPVNKASATEQAYLRIFTSTIPTDYRLTTLMHDSQYRLSVAWQNVAYNQPTHQSYYIGSVALASDGTKTLNYLAPETPYTKVAYKVGNVAVTGISLSTGKLSVERGKTAAVSAQITPADATKKSVTWTSSNPKVATVANGMVKGVSEGKTTITATTKDGGFTASCEVTVYSIPIEGIKLSDKNIELGTGISKTLIAGIVPSNATDTKVTWTSSDPTVADVDEAGVVTGKGYGTAVITAEVAGYKALCNVRVKPIGMVDATGTDSFISSTNTTDFKGTADSASLSLNNSTNAVNEFHKDFKVFDDNKAVLNYKFVTGGTKDSNGAWNWDGREYTFNFNFLGENGENILTLSQEYKSSAQSLMSKVGTGDAKTFSSDWTMVVDGIGNIQGSSKRWIVNIEFDYNTDKATATISGCDNSWNVTGMYKKTFSLNGAKFKTLKYSITNDTANQAGGVTAEPSLSGLTYKNTSVKTGKTNKIYQKGVTDTSKWQESHLSDWKTDGAELKYTKDNGKFGRIYFDTTKPASAYSAAKTVALSENSLVTYDLDWYFGNSTSRAGNIEYVKIGSDFVVGWNNGYVVNVSTDGGTTWNDKDGDGTADSIFTGSNAQFTKNINVTVDTATKTIKSFKFDGKEIAAYTNYKMSDTATFDAVSFGFMRVGATGDWSYPCGLDSVTVSEFVEGEDEPVDNSETIPAIGSYADKVEVKRLIDGSDMIFTLTPSDETNLSEVKLYVVEYGEDGLPSKISVADNAMDGKVCTITAQVPSGDYRMFMWDKDYKPIVNKLVD